MDRKDKIIDYLDEVKKYNSDMNGTGSLDKIYDGYTFEEALDKCLKMEDEVYAKIINRCPGKTFLLMRGDDDKIVGMINVRWNLTDEMKKFGGNIGYSIRPTERRKGYNKINLYLGLIEAKKLGLERIMIDCSTKNIGSDKTIQALGGVLDRCEIDPSDNEFTNVYFIDVNNSINVYQKDYKVYIKK